MKVWSMRQTLKSSEMDITLKKKAYLMLQRGYIIEQKETQQEDTDNTDIWWNLERKLIEIYQNLNNLNCAIDFAFG